MRIIAILAAYNEERFIELCISHLRDQGVEVYLLDNESTDRTVELAERYRGKGLIDIERFPRSGVFDWRSILRRKEELAETLDADWLMHIDADEIRLPPRSDRTLSQMLEDVDDAGFNAVNFMEFTFTPTRESPDHDHPRFLQTMRSYYPFSPSFPDRVNAWKRQPARVDLASMGGHHVQFPSLRLFPESFRMRHYLFLSVGHFIEKYARRSHADDEVKQGWHGWRSRVDPSRIELPSREELREYHGDDTLDATNPRTQHFAEMWSRSELSSGHA